MGEFKKTHHGRRSSGRYYEKFNYNERNILSEDDVKNKLAGASFRPPEGVINKDNDPLYDSSYIVEVIGRSIDGADVGGVSEDDDITLEVTSVWSGTQAEAEMVVDGKVKEVYIKDSGTGYQSNATAIIVEKDPSDTVFTGDNFRDAILRPVVVDGQITKVRIKRRV